MASRIVRFCCTHISQHGPCTGDELYAAARAAAVTAARSPASLLSPLRNDPRVVVRPDGRYDAAARLLAGTVLTHRVRFPTSGHGELWAGRELAPLAVLMADGDLPLATGGSVRAAGTWPDAWTGPVGWLPHVESDELLGLQWTGAVLEVAPASVDRDVAMERAARVCQVLARHRPRPRSSWSPRPGGQETLAEVVLAALVEVPDLLAVPLHPLDEVVPMAPEDEPNWCVAASSYAAEPVETASLALHLPLPLRDELDRRAEFLGVPVHAYAEQVLAAAAWRTESRFRRSSPWAHEADPWRDGRPDDTGDHWPDPARDPWS